MGGCFGSDWEVENVPGLGFEGVGKDSTVVRVRVQDTDSKAAREIVESAGSPCCSGRSPRCTESSLACSADRMEWEEAVTMAAAVTVVSSSLFQLTHQVGAAMTIPCHPAQRA